MSNSNSNHPGAYMSPLREAAIQLNEMHSELVRSGFTRAEALEIIKAMSTGAGPQQ